MKSHPGGERKLMEGVNSPIREIFDGKRYLERRRREKKKNGGEGSLATNDEERPLR